MYCNDSTQVKAHTSTDRYYLYIIYLSVPVQLTDYRKTCVRINSVSSVAWAGLLTRASDSQVRGFESRDRSTLIIHVPILGELFILVPLSPWKLCNLILAKINDGKYATWLGR